MVRGRIAVSFLMWSACVGDVADGDRNEERRDIGSQVLSKDPHWRDPSTPTIDPATAIGWLRGSLRAGEVLEQVRLTPLVESAHTLVEGVAQSTGDARLLVFDENGSASTKRIKNGASLQLCGTSTSEPVSVAWDYYSNGVIQ